LKKIQIIILALAFIFVTNLPVFAFINNTDKFLISEQAPLVFPEKRVLAITDISNETGNPSLNYLKEVLANSLTTSLVPKLGNSVSVVERGKFTSILKEIGIGESGYIDINTAKKIGNALGATQILVGELIKVSDLYRLNIRLIDVNNSVILSAFTEDSGSENEILKMVDNISNKITTAMVGKSFQKEDNPIWLSSIILPGLGQMLLGEINRGILFMIGGVGSFLAFAILKGGLWAEPRPTIALLVFAVIHIWNISDAYSLAESKSKLISENEGLGKDPILSKTENIKITLYNISF
jgi:TolB-like protein